MDDTLGPNDAVFMVEAEGPQRGWALQFLSAPTGAEVCGPAFTPDNRTFFVAFQHPGLTDKATYANPGSRWPDIRADMPPRPSVVAIYRQDGGKVGGQGARLAARGRLSGSGAGRCYNRRVSEIFEQIDSLRGAKGRAALATLVSTHGTTPRKEGAKMWVGEDGRILGSVTIGGCVDAEVMAEAEGVLQGSRPKLLSLDLGDEDAWEIGLTCGGTIEVFVEPVALGGGPASDGALALYEKVRAHVATGGSAAILTRMDAPGGGAKLLLLDDGRREGSLGDPALDAAAPAAAQPALATGVSRTVSLGPGGAAQVFVEVHVPPATLVVVGGSHVAMPLVTLARSLGYRTVVIDGRPRLATRERFPGVDELHVGIPSELVRRITLGPTTALVLVAHDYKYDLPVLRHALAGQVGYIGMLGSRRRGDAILRMLRDEGVPDSALTRIRVPIGLDLGAKTAPEIALAILAEIVATRYGGTGRPLVLAKRGGGASEPLAAGATAAPDPGA